MHFYKDDRRKRGEKINLIFWFLPLFTFFWISTLRKHQKSNGQLFIFYWPFNENICKQSMEYFWVDWWICGYFWWSYLTEKHFVFLMQRSKRENFFYIKENIIFFLNKTKYKLLYIFVIITIINVYLFS